MMSFAKRPEHLHPGFRKSKKRHSRSSSSSSSSSSSESQRDELPFERNKEKSLNPGRAGEMESPGSVAITRPPGGFVSSANFFLVDLEQVEERRVIKLLIKLFHLFLDRIVASSNPWKGLEQRQFPGKLFA